MKPLRHDLVGLAERCEQATGPDRELDCLIHCALKGWKIAQDGPDFYAITPVGERFIMLIGQRPPSDITPRSYTVRTDSSAPLYTASLDAAMTLVPEGWLVEKLCEWPHPEDKERPFYCRLRPRKWGDVRTTQAIDAATPALALTAASLRARAQTQSSGDR